MNFSQRIFDFSEVHSVSKSATNLENDFIKIRTYTNLYYTMNLLVKCEINTDIQKFI